MLNYILIIAKGIKTALLISFAFQDNAAESYIYSLPLSRSGVWILCRLVADVLQ
jgi:hypothetical protein